MGTCPRIELCERCFGQTFAWFAGLARPRGEWWAQDVAARTGTPRASGRARGRDVTPSRDHRFVCSCPRDRLCPLCLAGAFDNLRGTAACRGTLWAESVARKVPSDRPWPPYAGKVAELAREKVGDLTSDPRLLEMLAAECAGWAAKRWRQLAAGAAEEDRTAR